MTHAELQELAPLYALGALDGNDLVQFGEHLGACVECPRLVREYEEASARLAFSLPPMRPSEALKERLLESVRGQVRRFAPMAWAAAAALLVAALLGPLWLQSDRRVKALEEEQANLRKSQDKLDADLAALRRDVKVRQEELEKNRAALAELQKRHDAATAEIALRRKLDRLLRDPEAQVATMQAGAPAPGASGRVVWKGKELAFVGYGLPALPKEKEYELWVLNEKGALRAGQFQVDSDGTAIGTYTFGEEPASVKGFALTLEPRGGGPSPTSDLYLKPK